MLDDSSSFLDDLESELNDDSPFIDESEPTPAPRRARRRASGVSSRLFGMTGPQRMLISMMVFGVVCILSVGFLVVAEKISFF